MVLPSAMTPTQAWAGHPLQGKGEGPGMVWDPAFTLPLPASVSPSVIGVIMVPTHRV